MYGERAIACRCSHDVADHVEMGRGAGRGSCSKCWAMFLDTGSTGRTLLVDGEPKALICAEFNLGA